MYLVLCFVKYFIVINSQEWGFWWRDAYLQNTMFKMFIIFPPKKMTQESKHTTRNGKLD